MVKFDMAKAVLPRGLGSAIARLADPVNWSGQSALHVHVFHLEQPAHNALWSIHWEREGMLIPIFSNA